MQTDLALRTRPSNVGQGSETGSKDSALHSPPENSDYRDDEMEVDTPTVQVEAGSCLNEAATDNPQGQADSDILSMEAGENATSGTRPVENADPGSDARAESSSKSFTIIDPLGDLFLHVHSTQGGEGYRTFQISSHCFRLASSSWRNLLESVPFPRADGCRHLNLTEESVEGLEMLLDIAHARFSQVPDHLESHGLVKLATLCEKYETMELVRPFLKAWTLPWMSKILEDGYEQWLYVAYCFGFQGVFELVQGRLAMELYRTESGEWAVRDGVILSKPPFAGALLDNLVLARNDKIDFLLEVCYFNIEKLSDDDHDCLVVEGVTEKAKCVHISLNSLERLCKLCLWPDRPTAHDITMSPDQLRAELLEIQILTAPGHEDCALDIQLNGEMYALGQDWNHLTQEVREHFEKYKKFGWKRTYAEPQVWERYGIEEWEFEDRDFRGDDDSSRASDSDFEEPEAEEESEDEPSWEELEIDDMAEDADS